MTSTTVIVDETAADLPRNLMTAEAAALLRITPRHVRRLLACGELKGWQHKPGGPLLIPKRFVLDYIEARLGG